MKVEEVQEISNLILEEEEEEEEVFLIVFCILTLFCILIVFCILTVFFVFLLCFIGGAGFEDPFELFRKMFGGGGGMRLYFSMSLCIF